MQSLLILSTHSFFDPSIKVGMQELALRLAEKGWQVDYVSICSSPLDIIGKRRRSRFRRVWLGRQYDAGLKVRENLTEYSFRSPLPVHRAIVGRLHLFKYIGIFAPTWFAKKQYFACIFDVTPSAVFLPKVQARHYVYRLNDHPHGFPDSMPGELVEYFDNFMRSSKCSEVWAVSKYLVDYARKGNVSCPVRYLPNGVTLRSVKDESITRRPKTAVYLGVIDRWFDQQLLMRVAELLPDWQFDLVGPIECEYSMRGTNISYLGTCNPEKVPALLRRYQVGLIPFREYKCLISALERPLKFYEYLEAGLSIASTDVGSLKSGMKDVAKFGSGAEEYADAIVQASNNSIATQDIASSILRKSSWSQIANNMNNLLMQL